MAGFGASVHIAPAAASSGCQLSLTLNSLPLQILITDTEVYQQEIATLPGFASLNDNVISTVRLAVTHPFDPLFLLLPALLSVRIHVEEG